MFIKVFRFTLISLLICPTCFAELSDSAKEQIEKDWLNQELTTRGFKIDNPHALSGVVKRGRLMLKDLQSMKIDKKKFKTTSTIIDQCDNYLNNDKQLSSEKTKMLYLKARWVIRQLAFSNPKIDFNQLLFVKRNTPTMQHQCGHRVGEAQLPGANICVLKGLNPDATVKELLSGEYSEGGIGRPDLSFDGKRVVFPLARKREKGTNFWAATYGGTGLCDKYDLYEINIDGTDLKHVVSSPNSEDTEPCYIPGERIAFTSSRNCRLVQCGDWALVNGIYSVKRDGSDIRKITEPQDGEFYPSILSDGRIMYTRWDYVMKSYNTQQQLWAVNPDGRRAELIYGDHYKFSTGPIAFFEARQIPGTSKVITTGAAHHNNCVGPIMIVDLNKNRGGPDGMQKVTPELHYPEIRREGGGSTQISKAGWYGSPYPLTENHYIVSYTFDKNSRGKYGIYLMDIHGNKELIYNAPDKMSCYSAIPVKSRKEPPIIPDLVSGTPEDTMATVMVNDVYQGLLSEAVKRGEVKHLRIIEVLPKTQHTVPRRMDVGVNSGWDTRRVLGTVPVEPDGSAHFKLPPHKLILLEALDKDYLEIKRMRNYMNVKQGETVSCIGCHEPYGMAPPNMSKTPMATRRVASEIIPPPWKVRGMSFKHVVQPILDKRCISCHDGSQRKGKAFSLKGKKMVRAPHGYDHDEGPQHLVSQSFLNLLPHVNYVKVGAYANHDPKILVPSPANSIGSRASKLMKMLKKGHNEVKLDLNEWRAIAAWIDCNAPYYGDFSEIMNMQDLERLKSTENLNGRLKQLKTMHKKEIVAYLNCGAQKNSLQKKAEKIKMIKGSDWIFKQGDKLTDIDGAILTVSFDTTAVVLEISGLKKGQQYSLGTSLWEEKFENRIQSLAISLPDSEECLELSPATPIPNYSKSKQHPKTQFLKLPRKYTENGTVHVKIVKKSGPNAIISELILVKE